MQRTHRDDGIYWVYWGGFNALQVAARRPPSLGAIATVYSTDDRYTDDVHYMGAPCSGCSKDCRRLKVRVPLNGIAQFFAEPEGAPPLEVVKDLGVVRFDDIDLNVHRNANERYTFTSGDFNSVRGQTLWQMGFSRGAWEARTTTRTVLTSSTTHFHPYVAGILSRPPGRRAGPPSAMIHPAPLLLQECPDRGHGVIQVREHLDPGLGVAIHARLDRDAHRTARPPQTHHAGARRPCRGLQRR
ncbi:hypothetical protein [Pseudactinotalea sp. Z1748]|uniref:hypothetical protein n=1 Tax=Pseudactinotalea sp. Z1748 TaxID=3413027 RepID=UPI003C7C2B92